MSRPKVKNNEIHPVVTYRIKLFCFDNLDGYYDRYLKNHVSFDAPRFRAMMRGGSCYRHEEASLYLRLAAVERLIRETYAQYDLIDEGQVQWAVEAQQPVKE